MDIEMAPVESKFKFRKSVTRNLDELEKLDGKKGAK